MIRTTSQEAFHQRYDGRLKPQAIRALRNQPTNLRDGEQKTVQFDMIAQVPPGSIAGRTRNGRFSCDKIERHAHAQQKLTEVRPRPATSFQLQSEIEMRSRPSSARLINELRWQP